MDKVFLDQSRIETENAPKELREHCQSPKVDLRKVASELETPDSSIGEALKKSKNEE